MGAVVTVDAAAVAIFPFCAATAAAGTELAYAVPAPGIEERSALELYDGDDDDVVVVG